MRFISWLKGSLDGVEPTGSDDSAPMELNQFTKRENGSEPEPAPWGAAAGVAAEVVLEEWAMGIRGRVDRAMPRPTENKPANKVTQADQLGSALQEADNTTGGDGARAAMNQADWSWQASKTQSSQAGDARAREEARLWSQRLKIRNPRAP